MKIAYLLVINLNLYDGVVKKIVSQIESWEHFGHNVEVFCITPQNLEESSLYRLKSIINVYTEGNKLKKGFRYFLDIFNSSSFCEKVKKDIEIFNPDVLYVRNTFYQKYLNKTAKKYTAIYEYNTSELNEFKQLSKIYFKYKLAYIYYLLTYKHFFNSFKGVVCVTYELEREFLKSVNNRLKTIVIPNTLNLKEENKTHEIKHVNSKPNLLFIGTPGANWHGLDIIESFAEETRGLLDFHIVGFEKKDNKADNIHYYGMLFREEYQKIIDKCDVGIGTIALYRKKMEEACPLKVREYLLNGLPVILCYQDTAFIKNKPDWLLELPNKESSLSLYKSEILNFCSKNRGKRVLLDEVRPFIDSLLFEEKRLDFFKAIKVD